jgi:hypothetical protein
MNKLQNLKKFGKTTFYHFFPSEGIIRGHQEENKEKKRRFGKKKKVLKKKWWLQLIFLNALRLRNFLSINDVTTTFESDIGHILGDLKSKNISAIFQKLLHLRTFNFYHVF